MATTTKRNMIYSVTEISTFPRRNKGQLHRTDKDRENPQSRENQ
jgi:hypothetical protein